MLLGLETLVTSFATSFLQEIKMIISKENNSDVDDFIFNKLPNAL